MKPTTGTILRFEALDAWRGICALIVALEHLNIDHPLHRNVLVHNGYRFVDFFFVLSGFVIAHAYREKLSQSWSAVWMFLVRRVGRLWPLHATVLVAFIGLEVVLWLFARDGGIGGHRPFTERTSLGSIPINVAMIHSWGLLPDTTWNGPSWSISVEWFAYIVFALGCVLTRAPRTLLALAMVLVGSSVFLLIYVSPSGMQSTYDFGLVRGVFGFMLGVITKAIWDRTHRPLGTLIEALVVVGVVAAAAYLPYDQSSLLVTPIFALAVWVFASEGGAISNALRARIPQALGAWSYSIYMVHAVIMLGFITAAFLLTKAGLPLLTRVDGTATIHSNFAVSTGIVILYIALILMISRVTYRQIELRGQRLFQRWTRGRDAAR